MAAHFSATHDLYKTQVPPTEVVDDDHQCEHVVTKNWSFVALRRQIIP